MDEGFDYQIGSLSLFSANKKRHPYGWRCLLAEDEGFEPPQTESESGVLPLHKSSIWNGFIIRKILKKSTPFLQFFKNLFSFLFLQYPMYF